MASLVAAERDGLAPRFFPALHVGLARRTQLYLRPLMVAAWHLMISGRTMVEDAEGAVGKPEYLYMLKIAIAELAMAIDCLLKGADPPSDLHRFAMAVELGFTDFMEAGPDSVISLFALEADQGSAEEYQRLADLWQQALDAFPSTLPNPLVPGSGQRDLLNILRHWSKLLADNNIDSRLLAELYRTI